MANYRTYLPLSAPSWLQGPNGTVYLGELGGMFDGIAADMKAAAKQRLPGSCFPDALPLIGDERQIDRGTNDTNQQYAARLTNAWTSWSFGGSGYSILKALAALGYTATNGNPTLVQQNGLYLQLDAAGNLVSGSLSTTMISFFTVPWWTYDGQTNFWQRFSLLFPSLPTGWSNVQAIPSGITAPTLAEVNTIRRTVNKWRAAKALWHPTMAVCVQVSGKMIGWPVRTLGGGNGNLGGSVVQWGPTEQ